MRELKFRCWHDDTYSYNIGVTPIQIEIYKDVDNKMITPQISMIIGNEFEDTYVEQFTGLYDRNGKEIYEGDIVCYENSIEAGVAKISNWIGNNLYFEWLHSSIPPTNTDIFGCASELKVIGNIHENPELLK